jgi:hypothetical protein
MVMRIDDLLLDALMLIGAGWSSTSLSKRPGPSIEEIPIVCDIHIGAAHLLHKIVLVNNPHDI